MSGGREGWPTHAISACDAQGKHVRKGFLDADQILAICEALPEPRGPIVKLALMDNWSRRRLQVDVSRHSSDYDSWRTVRRATLGS